MIVKTWRKYNAINYSECIFDTDDIILLDLTPKYNAGYGNFYNVFIQGIHVTLQLLLDDDIINRYWNERCEGGKVGGYTILAERDQSTMRSNGSKVGM